LAVGAIKPHGVGVYAVVALKSNCRHLAARQCITGQEKAQSQAVLGVVWPRVQLMKFLKHIQQCQYLELWRPTTDTRIPGSAS